MKKNLALLLIIFSFYANANVRLPLLFSDGMVLQRNKPIPVWGWADANEKIEIHFNKQTKTIKADKNGKWSLKLDAEMAGGPFELSLKGKNKIVIKNILVGEVWICSGQSNMEFTVKQAQNFESERNDADYPMIHHFMVDRDMSGSPKEDIKSGKWEVCNKSTVGDFTAVGYFFAKKLYKELKIPIGIIHSSWGGTIVETWTSREAFENSSEFKEMISGMPKFNLDTITKSLSKSIENRIEKLQNGKVSQVDEKEYIAPSYNDTNWLEMNVPDLWENQEVGQLDGVVWMRKTIVLSGVDTQKGAFLRLAKIDDEDITYVNGIEIGRNTMYTVKREYTIPAGILKEGKNTIAVRVVDNAGGGGIYGEASDLKLITDTNTIPLDGKWKYKVVKIVSSLSPNSYPTLLYNAMISPLIPYAFQGVLWYQGESNAGRAFQYRKAFPLMISDWRQKWNQGDFPFYFVQLATYTTSGNSNEGCDWAELREAQTMTLQLPNTGMAVTTDIGIPSDIHPTNKQDVGKRLAAIALNKVYNKDVIYSGPTYKSMEIQGNQITASFDNTGSGISTSDKYGYIKGFEVAGKDQVFYYAKAFIIDNKVVIISDNMANPVALRFGWIGNASDNNLFNKEGFPAVPFRTDDWKTITKPVKYKLEQ